MNITEELPWQLQRMSLRFYLARDKLPIEKEWTTNNNYIYFHEKLVNHTGNYGVVCGYGNLIVLDFDNITYYESVATKLPKTFTVLTAKKRYPHMYYFLDSNDTMFKKTAVRNDKGITLMDIQAKGSGVIGPGSKINDRIYAVAENIPIANITCRLLEQLFRVSLVIPITYHDKFNENPGEVLKAHKILSLLGIETNNNGKTYRCPFHIMEGTGNLAVMPSGRLYCFHEQKMFNIFYFAQEYLKAHNDDNLRFVIDIIMNENGRKHN